MSTYSTPLSSGKTSPKGFLRVFGKIFTGNGVVEADALTVSAQESPDMTVKVSGSALDDNAIFIHSDGTFIQAWNEADENVTITANASGVEKTDAIVAYVDVTDYDASNANNPGSLKFIAVRRDGDDTGNPTTEEIETAVSDNPYILLAYVTVANGASSINSGNITDQRSAAQIALDYAESITPAKRSGGFKVGLFTTNSSTGNQSVTGIGFKPKMVEFTYLSPGGTTFGTGIWGEGGMDENGNQWGVGQYEYATSGVTKMAMSSSYCIYLTSHTGGEILTLLRASYVSMDEDGFTINIAQASSRNIGYKAYG